MKRTRAVMVEDRDYDGSVAVGRNLRASAGCGEPKPQGNDNLVCFESGEVNYIERNCQQRWRRSDRSSGAKRLKDALVFGIGHRASAPNGKPRSGRSFLLQFPPRSEQRTLYSLQG